MAYLHAADKLASQTSQQRELNWESWDAKVCFYPILYAHIGDMFEGL